MRIGPLRWALDDPLGGATIHDVTALRVLMVVPEYPPPVTGGVERQAHTLGVALVRRGVHVEVLAGRTHPSHTASDRVDGIRVHRLRLPQSKLLRFPWTGLAMLIALVRLLPRFDIVHAHSLSWSGTFAVFLARLMGKSVVAKLPTSIDRAFPGSTPRFEVFRRCDAVIAMTPESADDLEARGFPPGRVVRVTNGVDTELFHPGSAPGDPHALTVLFSGRLIPLKGLSELLEEWPAIVAAVDAPVELSICGSGPQGDELRALAERLGIQSTVRFEGRVADLPNRLRAADLFVLPSHVEGNSNSVLEAMATGLPIVSTRAGGTPLLVGPEGQPWLVEPGDGPALREKLTRLLRDGQVRRQLGDAMLARVHSHLSIDRVSQIYGELYRALCEGTPNPAAVSSPIFAERPSASGDLE